VILPVFLAAALAFLPQGPSAPVTVTAVGDGVSAVAVAEVRRSAEVGLRELHATFAQAPQPFRIFVHRREDSLDAAVRRSLHAGAPGLALLERQEIHLVLDNLAHTATGQLHPVVVHELVHILLHQSCKHGRLLPRWLHEGLAQTLAEDTYLGTGEQDLIWRATGGRLLPFDELADDFPKDEQQLRLAYAQSHSYVAFLVRDYGIRRLLAAAAATEPDHSFLEALVYYTGRDTNQIGEAWRDYLLNRSGARFRVLLEDGFSIVMLFALPLLALAMIRRMAADRRARERLARDDPPMPEPDDNAEEPPT
jgi:hypothetical protein